MKDDGPLVVKSKAFALRMIKVYSFLTEHKEFILSKQLLRSGTSIGANIREAERAPSQADFCSKLYIAFKEAGETEYWLELLYEGGILTQEMFNSLYSDCKELSKMLSSVTKTLSKK